MYQYENHFILDCGEEYTIYDEIHVCDPCHCTYRNSADISRYWVSGHFAKKKTRSCDEANSAVTGDTTG